MANPIEVVRDQSGYFRQPNGRPLVVIFDSKEENPSEISWQEPVIGTHTHINEPVGGNLHLVGQASHVFTED